MSDDTGEKYLEELLEQVAQLQEQLIAANSEMTGMKNTLTGHDIYDDGMGEVIAALQNERDHYWSRVQKLQEENRELKSRLDHATTGGMFLCDKHGGHGFVSDCTKCSEGT